MDQGSCSRTYAMIPSRSPRAYALDVSISSATAGRLRIRHKPHHSSVEGTVAPAEEVNNLNFFTSDLMAAARRGRYFPETETEDGHGPEEKDPRGDRRPRLRRRVHSHLPAAPGRRDVRDLPAQPREDEGRRRLLRRRAADRGVRR